MDNNDLLLNFSPSARFDPDAFGASSNGGSNDGSSDVGEGEQQESKQHEEEEEQGEVEEELEHQPNQEEEEEPQQEEEEEFEPQQRQDHEQQHQHQQQAPQHQHARLDFTQHQYFDEPHAIESYARQPFAQPHVMPSYATEAAPPLMQPDLEPFDPFAGLYAEPLRQEPDLQPPSHKRLDAQPQHYAERYAAEPYESAPVSASASAILGGGDAAVESEARGEDHAAVLSDGWDEETEEGEYRAAPQSSTPQHIRRPHQHQQQQQSSASSSYSSSPPFAQLLAHPHFQTLVSSARMSFDYTRSTLESGVDLAGKGSAEFMEKVVPVLVAGAAHAASRGAETLSTSVMPQVSHAMHATSAQLRDHIVPGVVQQAKAVQRWLAQRVHLTQPLHPSQLILLSSSHHNHGQVHGTHGGEKEELESYISYIENALKQQEAEEQEGQAASSPAAAASAVGSPPSAASASAAAALASQMSGQPVLLIDNHFSLLTEREKAKLMTFLSDIKKARMGNSNQQQRRDRSVSNADSEHSNSSMASASSSSPSLHAQQPRDRPAPAHSPLIPSYI